MGVISIFNSRFAVPCLISRQRSIRMRREQSTRHDGKLKMGLRGVCEKGASEKGDSLMVVISPLKSLMEDQVRYLKKFNLSAVHVTEDHLENLHIYLNRVASWCCENQLLINPDKTNFCVFGTKQMLSQISIPPMMFLGKELPIVDSVKDLGVIIDKHLSFNDHIDALASDLVGKLAMISRIRHLFDKHTLFTIINSIVFTKLFYCSSVWSGTSKSNISKLQQVQNFAVRVLSGHRKFDHISPTLKENKILPVAQVLKFRDAVQMYKCENNLAPMYLTNMFKKRSAYHKYSTRTANEINLPKCRTALAQKNRMLLLIEEH